MVRFFLALYDFLSCRKALTLSVLAATVALCLYSLCSLHYEEDISEFLPIDKRNSDEVEFFSQLNEQSRIAVIFRYDSSAVAGSGAPELDTEYGSGAGSSEQALIAAMDCFENLWYETDSLMSVPDMSATVDESSALELIAQVQTRYPSFLREQDYERMDSLLAVPGYVRQQLEADRRLLALPQGAFLATTMPYDPLHLFTPVLSRLAQAGSNTGYRIVDGHLLHSEKPVGLIFFDSPHGESESMQNEQLSQMLSQVGEQLEQRCPGISVSAVGSPLIAATNAHRIKVDSIWAVALAVVGILLVLGLSFRNFKYILWIALSLVFAGVFSLGLIGLIKDSISIIVLGLGSIIVGIAANYPLHFMHYLRDTRDNRLTLRDMVSPLLTGNITTVSAFLCLIFLKAKAMHDLALFGSFMLVGTILFVLIVMPLFARPVKTSVGEKNRRKAARPPGQRGRVRRAAPWAIVAVTIAILVSGKGGESFDTDLHHINYMTPQQQADLDLLAGSLEQMGSASVVASLLPEDEEERAVLDGRWPAFWKEHASSIAELQECAQSLGFSQSAFAPFLESVRETPELLTREDFSSADMGKVVSSLVASLSQDFDMVLAMCSLAVFFFLWLSFGSLELALLSFLPLMVGWVWILGIMNLLGLQFNIVSIVLATFIFGQGDDYTIYITEGLMKEYATGKRSLSDRSESVLISAILMFIGIGTLIISGHPAMRSLAEITILGMFVVVVMACFLPEWIFRYLTLKHGKRPRQMPVTLLRWLRSFFAFSFFLLVTLIVSPLAMLVFALGPRRRWKEKWLHRVLCGFSRFVIRRVPGTEFELRNDGGEDFSTPAVIISNHQSHLDIMCLLMLTPKMVLVTNKWVWNNPLYAALIHRAEFVPADDGMEDALPKLRELASRGYSIMIFPEGSRSEDCSIGRFHRGAFHVAQELGLDILPVFLHGVGHVLPKTDFMLRPGKIYVEVGRRVSADDTRYGSTSRERTSGFRKFYREHYAQIRREREDAQYWLPLVRSQYLYKGSEVESRAKRSLSDLGKLRQTVDSLPSGCTAVVMDGSSQGEVAFLMALTHPDTEVFAYERDAELHEIAAACANAPANLHFLQGSSQDDPQAPWSGYYSVIHLQTEV